MHFKGGELPEKWGKFFKRRKLKESGKLKRKGDYFSNKDNSKRKFNTYSRFR